MAACRPHRLIRPWILALALLPGAIIFRDSFALECPGCDDANACTVDSCDTEFGTCRHEPLNCDDGNQCTADGCAPETGCIHTNQIGPCDDGNPCSSGDRCVGATCTPVTFSPAGSACDDHNQCTENDTCDAAHACVGQPRPAGSPCDDANICTDGDVCLVDATGSARCSGAPFFTCNDLDPCTVDACDPAFGCVSQPMDCDDGNPCTADSCDSVAGHCLHLPIAGTCQGPAPCAQYACDRGNCSYVGGPLSCDDGVACTRDTCAPDLPGGCRHVPDSGLCPFHNTACRDYACSEQAGCVELYDREGSVCGTTFFECLDMTCQDGLCQMHWIGPEKACNGGNPCLRGQCGGGACVLTGVNTGAACDDRNSCTTQDHCDAQGVCVGSTVQCSSDGLPCTVDACQQGIGCTHLFNPAAACDDGNPCTTEVCASPTSACGHEPRTGMGCADLSGCTTGGTCRLDEAGRPFCDVPLPASCDDGNPCTQPILDPTTCDCTQQAIARPVTCGVGACARTIDACEGGVVHGCVPGTPSVEVCNGIDDDCDGVIDDGMILATCTVLPAIIRDAGLVRAFSVTCRLHDRCSGGAVLPTAGAIIDRAYVSAADLLFDASDNQTFTDPALLACPDPQRGEAFERGLVEDLAARKTGADNVTFVFDRPSDGVCSTLDGARRDLAALLADLPDGAAARVCVSSLYNAYPFQGCGAVLVRHSTAN